MLGQNWLAEAVLCALFLTALALLPLLGFFLRGWEVRRQDIFSSFSVGARAFYLGTFVPNGARELASEELFRDLHDEEKSEQLFKEIYPELPIEELQLRECSGVVTAESEVGPSHVLKPSPSSVPDDRKGPSASKAEQVDSLFAKFYERRYGRHRYACPTLLFGLVCLALTLLLADTAISKLLVAVDGGGHAANVMIPIKWPVVILDPIAAAAVAGAFLWIVADFVGSVRRNDLQPADVWLATLRLSLSAPVGIILSTIVTPSFGPFLAFAIGAFPLSTVRLILRRLSTRLYKLDLDVTDQGNQITRLDGIDRLTADRLQEYGITTIPHLAFCDPLQLCIRTGFSFDFISDACAQSLAWNYFGEGMNDLRRCSLRSSGEIWNLDRDLQSSEDIAETPDRKRKREAAERTLQSAAALLYKDANALSSDEKTALFRHAITEVAGGPYATFLALIWNTRWSGPVTNADIAFRYLLGERQESEPEPEELSPATASASPR